MRFSLEIRLNNLLFKTCIILVMILSATRIYRNSIRYSSTDVGGIWNVITVVFYGVMILIAFRLVRTGGRRTGKAIVYGMFAGFLMQFNALLLGIGFSTSSLYYWLMIPFYSVVFYVFYHICPREEDIDQSTIKVVLLSFVVVSIVSFVAVFYFKTGRIAFSMVADSYYALCLLPMILLFSNNRRIQLICYITVGIIVLFSGKRLGMICYALVIIVNSFLTSMQNNNISGFFKGFFKILIAAVIFTISYIYLSKIFEINVLDRLLTLREDGGSSRDVIYNQIWYAVSNSSIFNVILGHGMSSVGAASGGHAAHCDFLEFLYNFGILPTLLFILMYVVIFIRGIKLQIEGNKYAPILISSSIMSILLSLFSTYCVAFAYVTCGMATLGCALARAEDERSYLYLGGDCQ